MHCSSEDKTSDFFLGLSYLGFLFTFVKKKKKKKTKQQDTTVFKYTGTAFVSLNLLVENISHFPSSCDQNLICTSQVLSISNLNRHREILKAVTFTDVFDKHSVEQTQGLVVVGEGRVELQIKLFGRGTVIMLCMH